MTTIRRLAEASDKIFLTFDDGPCPVGTAAVLDVLAAHDAKATFFLIANRLQGNRELVDRMLSEGHAIGDHSFDHRYARLFRRDLDPWLEASSVEFRRHGLQPVGFRPPAGILTPPLRHALLARREPIIMWNERFFDAVLPWTKTRAARSARRLKGGDIVLLHDRQSSTRVPAFTRVLAHYIESLQKRGFALAALGTRAP
ncbi:MAG TPA: polysaccharide deacetylase family protein [Bdellovibrionales bacterium]|nr:polysaccharide deacetylase family protein [Bdellovibrionales bacterium]